MPKAVPSWLSSNAARGSLLDATRSSARCAQSAKSLEKQGLYDVFIRCVVWCCVVLCGVVWYGAVQCGMVWRGVAWRGVAWRGVA